MCALDVQIANSGLDAGEAFLPPKEVSMWPVSVIGGWLVLVTLLAIYVPTIYIRKTNKILKVLEQIEANTRK